MVAAWILFLTGCGSPANPQPWFSGNVQATKHPLVAQYSVAVSTAAQITIEFGTTTAYGRSTATKPVNASSKISILVAGMRPATSYHMRARIDFASGVTMFDSDHTFTTQALPSNITFPQVQLAPGSSSSVQGVDLISAQGPQVTAAVYDKDGSLIWYYYDPTQTSYTFPIRFLSNGDFLVQYFQDIQEVDLSGKTVRAETVDQLNSDLKAFGYSIHAGEFHHDVLRLDNGHWILLVNVAKDYQDLPGYPGTTTVNGDAIADLDAKNEPVWVWNTFDHLDVNRHPYMFPDWTHSNALVYTPDSNLLLSMRNQSWIIKINYANAAGNGDILWHLGPEGDFDLAQNDATQWFYNQHYPNILQSQGTKTRLAMFDNGNTRPDSTGQPCEPHGDCYSRGVFMDLDESAMTASVAWQYVSPWYSLWGGSIEQLPNGDMEVDFASPNGGSGRVVETDGSAMPKVLWELDSSNANFYRAYRIPSLYPGVQW
jgi:arylsulfate sulfotransferase